MLSIEDVLFKLRILADNIPCIESDNDIEDIIYYLQDKKELLQSYEDE